MSLTGIGDVGYPSQARQERRGHFQGKRQYNTKVSFQEQCQALQVFDRIYRYMYMYIKIFLSTYVVSTGI